MNSVTIKQVQTQRQRRQFATFSWQIYRHDPLWVPPLIPERMKQLNPQKGTFYHHGEADFFLAYKDGKLAGTIMAAEDRSSNQSRGLSDGMFGFFECINDPEVANKLFETAQAWIAARGLNRMIGPFHQDYDSAYGILIEGRDRPPAISCGHTPPYYEDLVLGYGFTPYRPDNIAFAVDITEDTREFQLLHKLAQRAKDRGTAIIREARLSEWDAEADRIHILLNKALAHLDDYVGWDRQALDDTLEPFRKYADPYLVLFADVGDQTVGFFPGIPNLNEILHRVNGLRYPWDLIKMLRYRKMQPKGLAIKSVLVLPEYWGTGVSLMLFSEMLKRAREKGYDWIDLSLTSEDNPKTPMLATRLGAKLYKRYRVYQIQT
ncbi:MAG: GNAT family N-acetyltransferase [Anaerolineaceae bacterium]|jgi:GNAT superfamily N-acetyltransferase|nr:GNAT family N-acetyltransferase [Anaerolineaceae bacterium]